ncbi:MAG: hypothetical protein IJX99_06920 [Clostridia bacterium]|nr:hypothetical protein [Clostridia bacterium]
MMRLKALDNADDTSKDAYFKMYLEDAKNILLDRIYPFEHEIIEVPSRYQNWQLRAGIELYNQLGEEGIVSYGENGLSYSRKTDLLSEGLISELPPPRAKVIGGDAT